MQWSIYTSEGLLTFLLTMGGNEDFFFLCWIGVVNIMSGAHGCHFGIVRA